MPGRFILLLEAPSLTCATLLSDMSNSAGHDATSAANTDASNAAQSLGAYQGDIGNYMSNVNSALSAGNPFESKDYLTQQNLATSGAMNSENDAAKADQEQTTARTGTNSAALAGEAGAQGRQGQRDLTNYNATRDTQNENSWLQQQDQLMGDQISGANSEAGVMGTQLGGQNTNLKTAEDAQQAQDAMWAQLGGDAMKGLGTGLGGAFCWVAAEIFGGWLDPRTILVRKWLQDDYSTTFIGRYVVRFYAKFGERIAVLVRKYHIIRTLLTPLFQAALKQAKK